jgi:hypothetical protein
LLGVSLVYFLCTWVAPNALLMNFLYLYKEKKKIGLKANKGSFGECW